MSCKAKFAAIFFSTVMMLNLNPEIANATVLVSDDFEYGGADTTDCNGSEALAGWKWQDCQDESNNVNGNGFIGVSSTYAHTGSKSMLMRFLGGSNNAQTSIFVEKAMQPNNWGTDTWISMWIYLAYEPGMRSRFDGENKWLYGYPDFPTQYTPGHWCGGLGTRRFTGTMSGSPLTPLPDDHTGLFFDFSLEGCAAGGHSGQNLSDVYIPVNKWSRLIVHVNSDNNVSPNFEAWIDPGTGRLVKVSEHDVTFSYNAGSGVLVNGKINNTRVKIGTTFPRAGASTNFLDSWIFVDDVIFATSRDDIDFPPSPPPSPQ